MEIIANPSATTTLSGIIASGETFMQGFKESDNSQTETVLRETAVEAAGKTIAEMTNYEIIQTELAR